ncbi:MAG: hypothetical protein FWG30_07710 [Eubacteriaceae bacterium]|nr:hypothetical protein [Eubacteriaceae bacterium]
MEHYSRFLYSVNTLLAYSINEHFYGGSHYVWCSPRFDAGENNPPSSNPKELVNALLKDVSSGDLHSIKIEQNRIGLLRGVNAKHDDGLISGSTKEELQYIIEKADISYFRPIIYIIDRNSVEESVVRVAATQTASLFSQEFLIEDLKTDQFDIIEMEI